VRCWWCGARRAVGHFSDPRGRVCRPAARRSAEKRGSWLEAPPRGSGPSGRLPHATQRPGGPRHEEQGYLRRDARSKRGPVPQGPPAPPAPNRTGRPHRPSAVRGDFQRSGDENHPRTGRNKRGRQDGTRAASTGRRRAPTARPAPPASPPPARLRAPDRAARTAPHRPHPPGTVARPARPHRYPPRFRGSWRFSALWRPEPSTNRANKRRNRRAKQAAVQPGETSGGTSGRSKRRTAAGPARTTSAPAPLTLLSGRSDRSRTPRAGRPGRSRCRTARSRRRSRPRSPSSCTSRRGPPRSARPGCCGSGAGPSRPG
jgi:hypothetical protein